MSKNIEIKIPELSLVTLIGASGAGKSTFAAQHFLPTEIVSSDFCRGLITDDENSLNANKEAFELVHFIANKRLERGNLTVIDATNVQQYGRKMLVNLARKQHVLPVAIVLNIPLKVCAERNKNRADRDFGFRVIKNQHLQLKQSLRRLKKEGFNKIYVLNSVEEVANVKIIREPLYSNKKELTGPFDIIGDVHGCFLELRELLEKLGYKITKHKDRTKNYGYTVKAPNNRMALFVGDLVDRGPASNEVLRLVMSMTEHGTGLCVAGNHDNKLARKLNGRNVKVAHGLQETLEQLATEPSEFVEAARRFVDSLVSHYIFDNGKLVLAHAGLREAMHGRASKAVRSFCMYGESTGETDEFGLPIRQNWALDYKGRAMVVYGHTPVPNAEWLNNTIDIDTGCVFGGKLTALRYPERELVDVPARKVWSEPSRPLHINQFSNSTISAQQEHDEVLHLEDVTGKRLINTRLRTNITIPEENSIAALEVMSRFAINPKWLVYLPPTMSPAETSNLPDFLEHPQEALDYFKKNGVAEVVCQEKHMGSRAIVVIGKDEQAILKIFGIENEGIGTIYTRTGRAFFNKKTDEQAMLQRLQKALTKSDFWNKFSTEWAVFDCELMPWSAKAQSLLKEQYAATGAAAKAAIPEVIAAMKMAKNRGIEMPEMIDIYEKKQQMTDAFTEAYRQYCWEVTGLDDYKLAPFHILATEGKTYFDKNHVWQMENIHEICQADEKILLATNYKIVDFSDENTEKAAIDWWLNLTKKGGEGMVVKPLDFITKNEKGVIQPAIKSRGREYLRIIYGAEYSLPENLQKLKKRGLGKKRSMAIREFALGVESLERFVRKEPLRRVHECVFGVLAMESEGVDPRL